MHRLGLNRSTLNRRKDYTFSRTKLADRILYFAAYLSLFRATGMWFGYPSSQTENSTIDSAPQQMLLYSIIPLIAIFVALQPQQVLRQIRKVPLLIAVFIALVLAATAMSRDLMPSVRGLVAVVIISTPVLLFKHRFGATETFKVVRNFIGFAVVTNLLYAAALPGTGFMSGSLAGSMRGMFAHKNFFGQFTAIAFVILVPSLRQRPILGRKNIVLAGLCLLALVSVVLSKSSTALVLAAVGLGGVGIFWVVGFASVKSVRFYLLLVLSVSMVMLVYLGGTFILANVAESFGKDTTFSGRTEVWQALFYALAERPIFGHGFALFRQPDYIAIYTSSIGWGPRSTHNTYLEIALNIGIPAAILWCAVLLSKLVGKMISTAGPGLAQTTRSREVAVILMVTFGAYTEAGMMLAPTILWVLLLAALPADTKAPKTASTTHYETMPR